MRLLILGCFVVLSQVISFPLYAAGPAWIKDSTKGCQIWNPNPNPAPSLSVTWSGSCVGGKAEGAGQLNWYTDGLLFATENLTGENGITMVAGNYNYKVSPSDVRLVLISTLDSDVEKFTGTRAKECGDGHQYLNVYAFANRKLALWSDFVVGQITSQALVLAQTRCSEADVRRRALQVFIYYEGDLPPGKGYSQNIQVSTTYSNGQWRGTNNAANNIWGTQNQKYQALLKKRNDDRNQQAQNSRRAAEMQAENAKQERYNAFIKKNSVSQFINTSGLEANPFIYEGKTIAAKMEFSEMLTADRGLFNGVVVSGLPSNLFSVKNTRVVLAGKVLGKISVKTPFGGEMSVPHLRFVGVHICANYACSDLVQ